MHTLLSVLLEVFLAYIAFASPNHQTEGECPRGKQCLPIRLCLETVHLSRGQALQRCAERGAERVCCTFATATARPHYAPATSRSQIPAIAYEVKHLPHTHLRPTPLPTSTRPPAPSEAACQRYRQYKIRGKRQVSQNIVGTYGVEYARPNEFPYMVAIGGVVIANPSHSDYKWLCGGSLISERYVLTAAHCFTRAEQSKIRPVVLRMGTNWLSPGPRRHGDYTLESFKVHPRFDKRYKYSDLALVRTEYPVATTASVQPVCLLPADFQMKPGMTLYAAGWGSTDPRDFSFSKELKKVALQIFSFEECQPFYKNFPALPRGLDDGMLCAVSPDHYADTCAGDSGGPLIIRHAGVDTLVGVTSFGKTPCGFGQPGVYANISPELKWIESTVWP